ncbi:MAG: type I 3-dehydroquinate dehydratase [Candidatus Omnitrophica bacterium]|nr:type I 3-dehydroquinate dehydratase [Candidatus Omnitrophota bacterium]
MQTNKPRIALVITDKETNAQIKPWGADLLELRVDLFKKLDPAYVASQAKRRRALKIPLLLSVRNQKKEGARKVFSDRTKWRMIETVLPLVDMVDIELSCGLLKQVVALVHKHGKKVIVSSHHFDQTPAHMEYIFKKALGARADIVKIAAKANIWDDVLRMIEFTHTHRKHPLITVSMGTWGVMSRLLLPAAGSLYTYAFLHKPTAPGQIDVKTLKSHLKFYYP